MLNQIIAAAQSFVKADKTVLAAVIVSATVSLVASVGFHLNTEAVGVISALVVAGLGYFVDAHFSAKLKAAEAKAAKAE